MRLLRFDDKSCITLTDDLTDGIPPYAILSHTWGRDVDEVTFTDLQNGVGHKKLGYAKIQFCGQQAKQDGIDHFWVDTCCIDKRNNTELSEAIVSMFRWYRNAEKCYVYLSDVSADTSSSSINSRDADQVTLRDSRWFKRGWTLQELLAPKLSNSFLSRGGIPTAALQEGSLLHYSVSERMQWAAQRQTKKAEDKAYCLLGIFDIYIPLIYGEGEHAFLRLQEAINKQLGASQLSIHTHYCVSRPANTLFTGRKDVLENLDHLIRESIARPSGDEQCRIVISGMGGQGKSEICLQLARRLRNRFWAILWIDVSTEAEAERSFLDIAQKLSVPAETWEDARHSIANLRHPWLMILDNADDLSIDYSVYFPDGNPGVVILTSRNVECQQYASTETGSIALDGLAIRDAQYLLLKSARIPLNQYTRLEPEAEMVAKLLQSHALALVQAGAYISNGHCTLSQYTQMYERRRHRLLGFRPKQARSRYGDVYTTFEVSADMLKNSEEEAARDALQLLPILAVCGPTRLPLILFEAAWHGVQKMGSDIDENAEDIWGELLTPWHASRLPTFLNVADTEWDSFRLCGAVQILRTLSLITVDSEDGHDFVSMHALVHAWVRDRQFQYEKHQSWLQMGCMMAFALAGGHLSQLDRRQLQAHCEIMTLWDMDHIYGNESSISITRILVKSGKYLDECRADAHLFRFLQNILQHLNLNLLNLDRRWTGLYLLASRNLHKCDRLAECTKLLRALLQIHDQSFAENDHFSLILQHELAKVHIRNGQTSEAVTLLEHLVAMWARVHAEDSLDRLTLQHELARVYIETGRTDEAVTLLKYVVAMRALVHAEDYPHLLRSQHELAGAYLKAEQTDEAINLFEHVVAVEARVQAEDHPDRLLSQHKLAKAYMKKAQTDKAIALFEHVVTVEARVLAEDHYRLLNSQHELARAYIKTGRTDEAVDLFEHVVTVEARVLAEDHENRLKGLHNLAACYWDLGRYEQARAIMTDVVRIRKHSLAPSDPDRQASEEWLDFMQKEMGVIESSS